MENTTYIESGILELYVYGLLSEEENLEVSRMAKKHGEINDEILSIERAIVNLSTSFSPFLSAENFKKIREKLELKHGKVVTLKSNRTSYIGWAAAVLLLIGFAYQYNEHSQRRSEIVNAQNENTQLQESLVSSEIKAKQTEDALAVVRDVNNTVISLGGQAVSPTSYAKVYYNKNTAVVYVDAAGLPEPPQGHVYQVWALKLNPLTPTSIGLLEDFKSQQQRIFAVERANGAEGFGITLEPAGGSKSPTMEQLYALGKV